MGEIATFLVSPEEAGGRVDAVVAGRVPGLSRARVQALVREGRVRVGGERVKGSRRVRGGERIEWEAPEPEAAEDLPEPIPLSVLYEDGWLIVVDKPAGMVVHPAAGNQTATLVNALLYHCGGALSGLGGRRRPGIVHRLDKGTSGCLVAAKHDAAHRALARQFAGRAVEKVYLALVGPGFPTGRVEVDRPVARHPVDRKRMAVAPAGCGREARTVFARVAELAGGAVLVRCVLHTGRTHQIRVHLKHLGFPLLGDRVYGGAVGWPRPMLHAWRLGFSHPEDGRPVRFESPIPSDFAQAGVVKELLQ